MRSILSVAGVVCGAILIVYGFNIEIPSTDLNSGYGSRVKEYVGGDAYNYIIAASLRSGRIAGGTVSKAVYQTGGIVVIFISLALLTLPSRKSADGGIPSWAPPYAGAQVAGQGQGWPPAGFPQAPASPPAGQGRPGIGGTPTP